MNALVLADAVIRCERRKLARVASANPAVAGAAIALVLTSPGLAYVLGGLAAPRLSIALSGTEIATQFVVGIALVTAALAAAFALRMPAIGSDLPQIVAGSVSHVRVVLGARVLPLAPAAAVGFTVSIVVMTRIASGAPGGGWAGVVWAMASAAIAALALCCAGAARTGRASTVALTALVTAGAWAALGLVAGSGAAAGPAGVAGRSLAGDASAVSIAGLAVLLLAAGGSALWLLANAPQRSARVAATRSRRLPTGASRAIAAASLLEALRSNPVRFPIASGVLLAVAGPLAIGELTRVPAFVTLLLTGMTAAVAVVGLPTAIRDAALKASEISQASAGAMVRFASLSSCLVIATVPLAAVALVTHAGSAELAIGARPLVIGVIAGAVACRVVPPMFDSPTAHYAFYGLVNALLALAAAAVAPELAGAIGIVLVALVVAVPDRKAVFA